MGLTFCQAKMGGGPAAGMLCYNFAARTPGVLMIGILIWGP